MGRGRVAVNRFWTETMGKSFGRLSQPIQVTNKLSEGYKQHFKPGVYFIQDKHHFGQLNTNLAF